MRKQKIMLVLLSSFFFFSCSSKRTQYQKFEKDEGGYSDRIVEGNIRAVRFEANSRTKRSEAKLFARYRAYEICRKKENVFAHILAVIDKSTSRKVIRSDADYWGPSYYYGLGTSPFYSRYGGFGFSTGINVVNSRAWEETLVFPEIEVIFHCTEKAYEPRIVMRDVPPEEMKHLVKDLKGGVQVEKILPEAANPEIKENDIIIRANGVRIMKGHQILSFFLTKPETIQTEVLREGERKKIKLYSGDVTEDVKENLEKLRKDACKYKDVKEKSSFCEEKK